LIEDLLKFFVSKKEREMFTCALYTCYEFIKPDIVLELSWRFGLMEYSMPFFVQIVSDLTRKVEVVQKEVTNVQDKQEKAAQ